ncbi:Mechanosensitive ion channel-domain-containing protein [Aspergillus egyptiacus]|nr:Mechanosensitive ion channel-domain-containing protein [Aspergillus egyptiacus]
MSGRPGLAEKRLSAHRFQQIPLDNPDTMHNPNEVTIDIPLSSVRSRGQTAQNSGMDMSALPPTGYPHGADAGHFEGGEKGLNASPSIPGSHGHRRRRVIDETTGHSLDSAEDGTVNRMGRFYKAIWDSSIVVRYIVYIVPLAILLAIPIIVGATAAQDAKIGGVALPWFFLWIEVIWVSLWVCKLFAKAIPFVFQFLCGIVSSGTRKYALVLRNLELPITTVLWMVVNLVTFLPIMRYNPRNESEGDTRVKGWEKSVKNILFALLVCSLIFLAQKTILHLIAISYHRKQFDRKIKESKHHVYLVGVLYEASRSMFPMYCKEFRDDDAIISDSILGAMPEKARPGRLRSSSSAPVRFIRDVSQNVGRFGEKITGALGDVAHEITGKQVLTNSAARSIVNGALDRQRSTEALARRIWMSFVVEGRESLFPEDIFEVLGASKEAEAEACFMMLDRDGNGDISLDEIVLAITEIARTRRALNHSIHDVDQAIDVLDNLLATVAFIIAVLVFISFVTSGFGTVIAAGATTILSLSFVFATTAQEVLGSCIFLFVKHPFDIGDRVEIDSKPYIVERISLLFSVFRNVTDHRVTQIPNVVLNTLWIDNYTRSGAMREKLTIDVAFDTSMTDVQFLKEEMEAFVRDKENSRDFQPDVDIDVVGVGSMDKLELTVSVSHKSNWAIESVRATRRSRLMCALVAALRKIPIRAPGADAGVEESPANEDGDNSDDGKPQPSIDEGMRRPANPDTAFASNKATGFDMGRSGPVQRRGHAGSSRSINDSYRPPHSPTEPRAEPSPFSASAPVALEQPSGTQSQHQSPITRGGSTGRRKAGATQPYSSTEPEPPLPSPHPQAPQPQPQTQPQTPYPYEYAPQHQHQHHEQPQPQPQPQLERPDPPTELASESPSSRTQQLRQVYEYGITPSPAAEVRPSKRFTYEDLRQTRPRTQIQTQTSTQSHEAPGPYGG